jgi:hypothetical protein
MAGGGKKNEIKLWVFPLLIWGLLYSETSKRIEIWVKTHTSKTMKQPNLCYTLNLRCLIYLDP